MGRPHGKVALLPWSFLVLCPYCQTSLRVTQQRFRKLLKLRSPLLVLRNWPPAVTAHAPFQDVRSRQPCRHRVPRANLRDRKSTRLNSSHGYISYAVFSLKTKNDNSVAPPMTSLSIEFVAKPRRAHLLEQPSLAPCSLATKSLNGFAACLVSSSYHQSPSL